MIYFKLQGLYRLRPLKKTSFQIKNLTCKQFEFRDEFCKFNRLFINHMDTEPKSYKTQILLAIITALSGIIIAMLGNWDKFSSKSPLISRAQAEIKPPDTIKKIPEAESVDYSEYNLYIRGAKLANILFKEGWDVKSFAVKRIQKDSADLNLLHFYHGYSYRFYIFSNEPTEIYQVHFLENGAPMEDSILEVQENTYGDAGISGKLDDNFYITIPNQKRSFVYAILVCSKKT